MDEHDSAADEHHRRPRHGKASGWAQRIILAVAMVAAVSVVVLVALTR